MGLSDNDAMRLRFDQDELDDAASRLGLRLVVAFGSQVGGELPAADGSDLDVAVLDGEEYAWRRFSEIYRALAAVFGEYELDLALLNRADPLFRFQIFRTAERLYGDSHLFCEQQCYAHKAYVDSTDLRALERTLYERKLAYIDTQLDD